MLGILAYIIGNAIITKPQNAKKSQNSQSLKFSDLPENEKNRYIDKNILNQYGSYITPKSYTQNFAVSEDNGTSILELLSQNKALVADNVDLGEKNLELIDRLDTLTRKLNSQKSELNSQNNEALKQQEEQHYENIQKITQELSQTQKEKFEIISNYEKQLTAYKNELDKLMQDADKKSSFSNEEFLRFKQESDANQSQLLQENELLKKDLQDIKNENRDLVSLKEELNLANTQLETLKSESKKEIVMVADGYDMQTKMLEDELSNKSNKIIDLNSNIQNLKSQLSDVKSLLETNMQSLQNEREHNKKLGQDIINLMSENLELNSTKKRLSDAEFLLENEQKINKALNKSIKDLKSQNAELNVTLSKMDELNSELVYEQNKSTNLNQVLRDLKTKNIELSGKLAKKDEFIAKLSDNISKLKLSFDTNLRSLKESQSDLINTKAELKSKQSELENLQKRADVDMKNYEILASQLNKLKKQHGINKQDFSNEATIRELEEKLAKSKQVLEENNKTISELNAKISTLNTKNISEKEYYKKIEELSKDIEASLNNQDKLEDENTNLKVLLQAQTRPEVPKKVVFVSQVECNDLDGRNEPNAMCKNAISNFLQRYNANYLYEITAIVDEKGLGLPYDVIKNIKKDDLARLEKFANEGVGNERARIAARLIKDEFGDFARISYAADVIVKENSRGFIIKAYR